MESSMGKKYQVFISSTFEDLKEEREEVAKVVFNNDCIPSGMEWFPAVDEETFNYIKRVIDESDYYLLILAGRYGSADKNGVSYTEREYDYAVSKGLKVIALVHGDPGSIPSKNSEKSSSAILKLEKFKKKVCSGRLVKFWSKKENLKSHIELALKTVIKLYPSVGWSRGSRGDSIRFFKDRTQLTSSTNLGQTLSDAISFEMISFSANVLVSLEDHFRNIMIRGGRVRLIMFDPNIKNDIHYSSLSKIVEDDPDMKRREIDLIFKKFNVLRSIAESNSHLNSVEMKLISGKPLLYNLWIKDRGLNTAEANLSVYSYRGRNFTPVFRSDISNQDFLDAIYDEFDHVWSISEENKISASA